MNIKLRTALLALTAAAGFSHGAASAGPVITDWTYSVSAVFDVTTSVPTFSSGAGCKSSSSNSISWGSCAGATSPTTNPTRSGITISNSPVTGSVSTNGSTVAGNTYTHYNSGNLGSANPAYLQTAVVKSTVSLASASPIAGVNFGPQTVNYNIRFIETQNTGPCLVASVTACDDIFVIEGLFNNALLIDDNLYYLTFVEASNALRPLSDAACFAVGAQSGCIGLTTPENAISAFTFNFMITSAPLNSVPEPSSLALLGLGLFAAGWARRRRAD